MTPGTDYNEVVLLGCGDVGPIHEPLEAYSTLARPTLAAADLRIAQCERVYSELGSLQVHSGGEHSRLPPPMASIFTDCGFDVVSMAGNHAMDWGPEAMLDGAEVLRARGLQVVGVGRNLAEARQPAIVERKGVRIAILGYCSVLRDGYAAGPKSAGVAPLRAHTYYEPVEYQAGVPPRVVTVPYEEDLAGLVEDVAAARQRADVIVLVFHWGIHFIPRLIADYQPTIAKAAFAAGADLILGHHAHVPKAVGVYDGKVCFYSLSNFIMSSTEATAARGQRMMEHYGVSAETRRSERLAQTLEGEAALVLEAGRGLTASALRPRRAANAHRPRGPDGRWRPARLVSADADRPAAAARAAQKRRSALRRRRALPGVGFRRFQSGLRHRG